MSCELIRVDFKKGVIKARETLNDTKKEPFNPYKDENFKFFTSGIADLAIYVNENGGDFQRIIVLATDEEAEIDIAVFDDQVISVDEAICAFKRIIEKLEKAKLPEGAA